jgi:hypothetical protein
MFPFAAHRNLQQIALAHIAAYAAHIIQFRDRFLGKRLDLASLVRRSSRSNS